MMTNSTPELTQKVRRKWRIHALWGRTGLMCLGLRRVRLGMRCKLAAGCEAIDLEHTCIAEQTVLRAVVRVLANVLSDVEAIEVIVVVGFSQ